MFMMTQINSNSSDSVDYQNAGPAMNFLCAIMHALDQSFVMSEYVTD